MHETAPALALLSAFGEGKGYTQLRNGCEQFLWFCTPLAHTLHWLGSNAGCISQVVQPSSSAAVSLLPKKRSTWNKSSLWVQRHVCSVSPLTCWHIKNCLCFITAWTLQEKYLIWSNRQLYESTGKTHKSSWDTPVLCFELFQVTVYSGSFI